MVALLGRLDQLARLEPNQVQDIEAYAAGIARRACSAWSRRRYPAFHRLRTRLRYLLNSDPQFTLAQDTTGDWICALASSPARTPAPSPDPDLFNSIPPSAKPAQAIAAIFTQIPRPLYFNDLARICARLWAIEDTPDTLETIDAAAPEPDAAPDFDARIQLLWSELRQLPQRQCVALLLNLRAPDGDSATSLLIHTGTASLRDLAALLDIDPLDFAALYPRLPLSDLEIADRLSITRQQVINLRKCARERLLRRMGSE
jgi:hypothetical protein